jgi:hypothetical protein
MTTSLRHFCRFARCGSKLREPVDTARRAFCSPHCHEAFYRNRCRVCEKDLPKGRTDRKLCKRAKCRSEYQRFPHLYAFPRRNPAPSTGLREIAPEESIKPGSFWRDKSGRGWRWEASTVRWQIHREDWAEHRHYEERAEYWEAREDEYRLFDRDGRLIAGFVPDQTGYRIFHPWPGRLMRAATVDDAKQLAISLALASLPLDPATAKRVEAANLLPEVLPQAPLPSTEQYLAGLAAVAAGTEPHLTDAPSIVPAVEQDDIPAFLQRGS